LSDEQVKPHRYSYWCFKCKRKVPADEIIREMLKAEKEYSEKSSENEIKRTIPVCPYCETRIKRNYKVWCNYCERTVKASELILHRTLLGKTIHLCPYCGFDRATKEKKDVN